jgi:endonuclease/exonuclease/phosphatase family metal-dependent hydrolase
MSQDPDVICLQEITRSTADRWRGRLLDAGYSVLETSDLAGMPYPPPPYPWPGKPIQVSRKNFNLTAARLPISPLPGIDFPDESQRRFAFPEKYLEVETRFAGAAIEIHNAHAPPGSTRKIVKPQAFAAMRRRLDESPGRAQVLCGDFNTPQPEVPGEPAKAHGDGAGSISEYWQAAERSILEHPRLRDAYRIHRNNTGDAGPFAISHRVKNSPVQERRYDHVYASNHFEVVDCIYLSEWLDAKLSDHAAVIVNLEIVEPVLGDQPD